MSVVIPACNEGRFIAQTLSSVARQSPPFEIVVADGGSSDDTVPKSEAWATVVAAPSGRARQMNRGWRRSSGDAVLFLHADTVLPDGALDVIRQALSVPAVESGTFRLRFDVDRPLLRLYAACTRLPWPWICFGDRGLFVRRRILEEIGGFRDLPIFEDLDMVRTLHRRGGFRFLGECVITSARRFQAAGPLRQQALNAWLWSRYCLGADPKQLASRYRYR